MRLGQVDDLDHLERLGIGDRDLAVHGREVHAARVDDAVVHPLEPDIDAACRIHERNGVTLLEAARPRLVADVEDVIGMGEVRLGRRDAPVVDVRRETLPRILAENVPDMHDVAGHRGLDDHVEPGVGDQQVPRRRGADVVDVVEHRQRDVADALEGGDPVDQDLRLGADVQPIADQGARLEQDCRSLRQGRLPPARRNPPPRWPFSLGVSRSRMIPRWYSYQSAVPTRHRPQRSLLPASDVQAASRGIDWPWRPGLVGGSARRKNCGHWLSP